MTRDKLLVPNHVYVEIIWSYPVATSLSCIYIYIYIYINYIYIASPLTTKVNWLLCEERISDDRIAS